MTVIRRKTRAGKVRYGVKVGENQTWVGTFDTRREAKKAEARAMEGRPRSMSCEKWAEHWLEEYAAQNKDSSYDTARSALKAFTKDFRGIPLDKVDRVRAERWARENRWRVPVVVSLMNAAVEAELVSRNVFKGLSNKGHGRKHVKPLTEADVERLAQIAENLHGQGAFIRFAAYSALRVGELFALEWEDIDWQSKRIMVSKRLYRGKLDLPKGNRVRKASLTPPAREALLALDRSTPTVFRSKTGHRLSQSTLAYYWQGITAKFGRDIDPHELKHFAGYYLHVVLNLPDRVVAAQLGHTDGGKLVRELYGHGEVGALDEIDKAFENVVPLRRADAAS